MSAPRLTLAHSPDSDDMVMWWPLTGMRDAEGRPVDGAPGRPAIDTGGFEFRCVAQDIETLNQRAIGAIPLPLPLGEREGVRGSVPPPLPLGEREGVRGSVPPPLPLGERAGVRGSVPPPLPLGERAGVRGSAPPPLPLGETAGVRGSAPPPLPLGEREGVRGSPPSPLPAPAGGTPAPLGSIAGGTPTPLGPIAGGTPAPLGSIAGGTPAPLGSIAGGTPAPLTPAPPGYDITAISAHAYPHIKGVYRITGCGGSFGEGYGPRLVARSNDGRFPEGDLSELTRRLGPGAGSEHRLGRSARVAVPGRNTTAFLVLSLMLGRFEFVVVPFDRIIDAVRDEVADVGLLIHEAQLTCERAGLRTIADLGRWWAEHRGLPLPLGLNVVRRDLDERFGDGTVPRVASILRDSIRHAREHIEDSKRFLRLHAGDRPEWRDDALLDRYLSMYVSDATLNMGERGREALRVLLGEGHEAGLCPDPGPIDVVGCES